MLFNYVVNNQYSNIHVKYLFIYLFIYLHKIYLCFIIYLFT
jgi:hypothetical protein